MFSNEEIIMCQMMDRLLEASNEEEKKNKRKNKIDTENNKNTIANLFTLLHDKEESKIIINGNTNNNRYCHFLFLIKIKPHHYIILCNTIKVGAMI